MSNSFSVFTYSPSDVQLIIAGYKITGWSTITIARSSKGFSVVKGIRGKNTRLKNTDTSATITVPLLQTVQSNDVFSEIHTQDLEAGTGRCTLTLKDMSGRSVFSSDEAFVTSYPTVSFSAGFEYRTWEIFCQSTSTYQVAGNSRPQTSLLDSAVSSVSGLVSGYL